MSRSKGKISIDLIGIEDFIEHFAWAYEGGRKSNRDEYNCCCCISESEKYKKKRERAIENLRDQKTDTIVKIVAPSTPSKNDEEKALKKKLKKERQKEKKNSAKQIMDGTTDEPDRTSLENNGNHCEPATAAATPTTKTITTTITTTDLKEKKSVPPADDNNNDNSDVENGENNDDNDIDKDDDINFLIDAPVVPAFVQSTILGKNNTIKMMKKTNENNKNKETSHVIDQSIPDDGDGFTSVKKGTKQAPIKFNKTPEGFGIQALKMIRCGNFPLAINYLSRAINLDSMDTRHYINRSFCYLRLGDYANALSDIKFASEHFTDVAELAKAKYREGQAFCGLQNYEAAELAFGNCLKLTPNCPYAKRELRRMQVCQMVSMGFNERDAILALQKHPDTTDAIFSLSTTMSTMENPDDSTESATDDEIYESDEEEEPSNESLLSKTLNYNPGLLDEPRVQESMASKITRSFKQAQRSESADRELRVIKTISPVVKPDPSVNELAIWVGNVTPFVTENMMNKRFGKFGKVISIWRAPTGAYCFINFQTAAAAKKALDEASANGGNIDVNGHVLLLKPAAVKSLKNCH